jgi:adenosylcobinamide-GDP ribazoletransferase
VIAVVVVLGVQVASIAPMLRTTEGAVLAGTLVCVSRCALALTCRRGVPAARPDGLGAACTGTVSGLAATASWVAAAAVVAAVATWADLSTARCVTACAVAVVVVLVLVRRAVRRFGGVTGDVFGAAIELALAALLVVAA